MSPTGSLWKSRRGLGGEGNFMDLIWNGDPFTGGGGKKGCYKAKHSGTKVKRIKGGNQTGLLNGIHKGPRGLKNRGVKVNLKKSTGGGTGGKDTQWEEDPKVMY